jgi:hypothetical protein
MTQLTDFDRELEENRRAYQQLREEIRTRYAGQFVALAFGKVVAAGADFQQVCDAVDQLSPEPKHSAVFHADDDPGSDFAAEYWSEREQPIPIVAECG